MTQHITQEQIDRIYTRYGGDMVNCGYAIARQAVANYLESVALAQPASEPAAVSGWKPIKSAPKDGMEILLGHPDGSLAVAYWNGTCFIEGDFNCDWATHWKPKPAAPTGEPG